MNQEWLSFLSAVQFLTRLPVPDAGWEDGRLDRAAKWFPLVGLLIGASCGAALYIADRIGLSPFISITIAVLAGILITGALHEDGLADTADGMGGRTRERRLAIMKDSAIGSYGVLALIFALVMRFTLYQESAFNPRSSTQGIILIVFAFIAAHTVSRGAMLLVVWSLPYARAADEAKVPPLIAPANRAGSIAVILTVALALAPLAVVHAGGATVALIATIITALGLRVVYAEKFGGWTGDTAGATQVICEIAFLLGLIAWT